MAAHGAGRTLPASSFRRERAPAGCRIVVKVNADENPETAQRYGILAMPTLSVFRNGEVISQVVGARPKRRLLADLGALP